MKASLRRILRSSSSASLPAASPAASSVLSPPAWRSTPVRQYNFASSQYLECFGDLPIADGAKLRADTIAYMENFDAQAWYEDPVTTLVDGKTLTSGVVMQTVDAFGNENGRIRLASEEAVREVKESGEADLLMA